MRVRIGKYPNWVGPYQIAEKLFFWMGSERVDKIGRLLAGKQQDSVFMKLCVWFHDTFKNSGNQRKTIVIDRYDTWDMHNTLSAIILPMLKQLKTQQKGSPYCDQEDLPEHMRLSERELAVFNNSSWDDSLGATDAERKAVDQKFFAQFDWILDQMIWSFEQELSEDEYCNYYDPYDPDETVEPDELFDMDQKRKMGKYNAQKHLEYQLKKQLGFTLFGKYFQSLWT